MTKVCCIDSRTHTVRRLDETIKPFRAPFGVAVTIDDYESFVKNYNSVISEVFGTNRIPKIREVYSSGTLKGTFDDPAKYEKILVEICTKLSMNIDSIGIYYSYFHGGKPNNVVIFREDRPYIRVEKEDFLNRIEWGYPHLCAWYYVSQGNKPDKILLDNFGGEITDAWRKLKESKMEIFFRGDEVNHGISTADLFIDFIQLQLRKQGKKLFTNDIQSVLSTVFTPNKISVGFLGQMYLKYTSPVSRFKMRTNDYVKHPVVFVSKDPEVSIKSIEDSEIMHDIVSYAIKNNASLKFFENDKDQKLLVNGDIILALGDGGVKSSSKIQKLARTMGKTVKFVTYSGGTITET